jgi:signal peptidase II
MIFIIVLLVLFFDQLTKFLATEAIGLNQSIPIINNIFHLTLVHNKGAAFGILKNQTLLFMVISLITIVIIFHHLRKKRRKGLDIFTISLALILSGAIGNFIDRISLGYVVDFLDFRIWPVFNLADSAITVGAILLGFVILKSNKEKKQN